MGGRYFPAVFQAAAVLAILSSVVIGASLPASQGNSEGCSNSADCSLGFFCRNSPSMRRCQACWTVCDPVRDQQFSICKRERNCYAQYQQAVSQLPRDSTTTGTLAVSEEELFSKSKYRERHCHHFVLFMAWLCFSDIKVLKIVSCFITFRSFYDISFILSIASLVHCRESSRLCTIQYPRVCMLCNSGTCPVNVYDLGRARGNLP